MSSSPPATVDVDKLVQNSLHLGHQRFGSRSAAARYVWPLPTM